ncbi:MAG: bifunctional riboflavin kinase/FAD synthetase [Armatimonadota bacterium]|nr:bifunctional riboflavin kinase/FAD synthetase [Armatimonadota bacterium]MDR7436645.1 bifunctional riboflavin kinase/FAD synthetase [Armatimonadota bacterium]MDR7472936.1 bifunctional riboflavin kinase/FAD synthetase [Armatimonadota bacterium]MDR7507545.1 bifunctional riboflavin kinase/FAD synthetase [Armatimonadota bacterium]MDR7516676.1 bifunctional riboflavin kinase/FAD synthetase [Armatimonadota bacterium]
MEVVHGLQDIPTARRPLVVALGTFDGVHRGHQALIAAARRRADALGGSCAVVTFDPHPQKVLHPQTGAILLTTLDERLALLADLGVDLVVVVRFDDALRQTPPDRWVRMLVERLRMAEVVCGPDYTFGRDRAGDVGMLRVLGAQLGFRVEVADPVVIDGERVSSSRIRDLLREGRVTDAARLLGWWYAVTGRVIRGDGRGRQLGFPTVNLEVAPDKLLPAPGIYAGTCRTPQGIHPAAISLGTRPTFGPGRLQVEGYLLGFEGDLYDRTVSLAVAARLRDEEAFPTVEALVAQMAADVSAVPAALARAAAAAGLPALSPEAVREPSGRDAPEPPDPP